MYHSIGRWLERRRAIRRRWQPDARDLVEIDEFGAYYAAQRLAARARQWFGARVPLLEQSCSGGRADLAARRDEPLEGPVHR